MFKSRGKLQISNGVRIVSSFELCRYYKKLFELAHWNTIPSQLPRHGCHISIYLPDIHGKNIDTSKINHLEGEQIEFSYNPENFIITKKNVWMNVDCPRALEIKNMMGIVDKNFWCFHIVVTNFKFE